MDRPKIICHTLQSVDGNIDGDFFTVPEIGSAYREFSRIREEFACDAVVSGATTAAEIYRGGFIGILPQASERWPRADRKAASAEKYAVVIDGTGSVRWESLVVPPVIDGGVRLPSAFDDSPLAAGHAPVALKLTYLQRLEGDALWLRYVPT